MSAKVNQLWRECDTARDTDAVTSDGALNCTLGLIPRSRT
jgi:hypothetical protein